MAKPNKNRKKQINRITAPITSPKQVRREVGAAARLEYGGTQRQIRGEKRASRQASRNINSWHKQYQDTLQNLRQEGIQDQAATANQAKNAMMMAGGQDRANRSALAAEEAKSAGLRGATPQYGGQSQSIEAAAQRSNLDALAHNRTSQIGQSNTNMLGEIRGAAVLGRNASLREERAVRQNLDADMRVLRKDKGAFKVSQRASIRQSERDYGLQKQTLAKDRNYADAIVTQAELGLAGKQASANAQVAAAQLYAGAKIKAQQIYGQTVRQQGKGGGKDITGTDIKRAQDYLVAGLQKRGNSWQLVKSNPQSAIASLTDRGVDPNVARIAVKNFVARKLKAHRRDRGKSKIGSKAWQDENDKRSGRR
jgi:hypothetical protein